MGIDRQARDQNMRRRSDGQDRPEKVTPFAELARWIRARALTLLSPTARDVLLALGSHTNSKGEAWPSAEVIADETAQGTTRHKRQTIYKAFREIERVGIYERSGKFQQPGYNVPGPIIFRLRPFNPQAATRLQSLLDVPVTGTSKRGDRKRFHKPVVPAPVNSDVPATGTQKGYLEREKERVHGKGSVRGKPYGQAPAPASPPIVEAQKLSLGLLKAKSTARDESHQLASLVRWYQNLPPEQWDQYTPHLEKQGYRLGTILEAQKLVADVRPYLPSSGSGGGSSVADPVAKPLLAARGRLKQKKLS